MDGALMLRECVRADYDYRTHEIYREMERDHIYSAIYPSYEVEQGRIIMQSLDTDMAVILLEEAEERFKRNTDELIDKRKALLRALTVLDNEEKAVFSHIVWGDPLDMTETEMYQVNDRAYQKLVAYFSSEREGVTA